MQQVSSLGAIQDLVIGILGLVLYLCVCRRAPTKASRNLLLAGVILALLGASAMIGRAVPSQGTGVSVPLISFVALLITGILLWRRRYRLFAVVVWSMAVTDYVLGQNSTVMTAVGWFGEAGVEHTFIMSAELVRVVGWAAILLMISRWDLVERERLVSHRPDDRGRA